MTPFEKAVTFVLAHEGIYSDDPNDSGGETRWGISKRSYPSVDIKNLTIEQATEIYKRDYWDRCKCGKLPAPISFILFDSAVNQGPAAAVRLLQKALRVSADGVVGPVTLQAIQSASIRAVVCAFIARRAYQYALHPQIVRFGHGWFNRLAECQMMAMEE